MTVIASRGLLVVPGADGGLRHRIAHRALPRSGWIWAAAGEDEPVNRVAKRNSAWYTSEQHWPMHRQMSTTHCATSRPRADESDLLEVMDISRIEDPRPPAYRPRYERIAEL